MAQIANDNQLSNNNAVDARGVNAGVNDMNNNDNGDGAANGEVPNANKGKLFFYMCKRRNFSEFLNFFLSLKSNYYD